MLKGHKKEGQRWNADPLQTERFLTHEISKQPAGGQPV